jgi:hypothetical protein
MAVAVAEARREGDEVLVTGTLRNGLARAVTGAIVDVGVYLADGRIVEHDGVYPVDFSTPIAAGEAVPFRARFWDPERRIETGFRVEAIPEARVPSGRS